MEKLIKEVKLPDLQMWEARVDQMPSSPPQHLTASLITAQMVEAELTCQLPGVPGGKCPLTFPFLWRLHLHHDAFPVIGHKLRRGRDPARLITALLVFVVLSEEQVHERTACIP